MNLCLHQHPSHAVYSDALNCNCWHQFGCIIKWVDIVQMELCWKINTHTSLSYSSVLPEARRSERHVCALRPTVSAQLLVKVWRISTVFHRSTMASDALRRQQRMLNLPHHTMELRLGDAVLVSQAASCHLCGPLISWWILFTIHYL